MVLKLESKIIKIIKSHFDIKNIQIHHRNIMQSIFTETISNYTYKYLVERANLMLTGIKHQVNKT